jgi:sigma-E factor negative regulatory protein RseC
MTLIIEQHDLLRYFIIMKPSIPETGTVLDLDLGTATILLKGGSPCKGCGAGKMGLCRPGGNQRTLRARNSIGAHIGDTVVVGIEGAVRRRGYLLAYLIPLISFMAGAFAGHFAGEYLGTTAADVPAAFLALALASFVTFRRLRRLDRTYMLTIKRIVAEPVFEPDLQSDEERRFESYIQTC